MSIDYSIFYRRQIRPENIANEVGDFDIFISAFNSSGRISAVFNSIKSSRKIYLVHPEYNFSSADVPRGDWEIYVPEEIDESVQINGLFNMIGPLSGVERICVDITGFMRSPLCFLVEKLKRLGVAGFSAIYSEPDAYSKQENTEFSTTTSGAVRPVKGMAGALAKAARKDYVVIGIGYDHKLVGEVLQNKESSFAYPIFAFPSLSPDMYQQSAVRAARSGEKALHESWIVNRKFAPANDPFSTAAVVADTISEIERFDSNANIYISPLSTKAQTLGFAIYWVLEGAVKKNVSLLMPECSAYSRETSTGIKRIWMYDVEFS